MSYQEHLQNVRGTTGRCAIITLSDTRTIDTDSSGKKIAELLAQANHAVVHREVCKDDPAVFKLSMEQLIARADIDAILTTGGTGISRRDMTIDVLDELIDQSLPGFGELFRMLSYQQIGSGAMLSRASSGIARREAGLCNARFTGGGRIGNDKTGFAGDETPVGPVA